MNVKVKPFVVGRTLNHIMEDVFNKSFSDVVGSGFAITNPSANIIENDQEFVLELAAPGLDKKDFTIAVEKDQLVISAQKESKEDKEQGKWNRKEFNFSTFKRSFHINNTINADAIVAEYENGVLRVLLPKKEEAKVSKVIDIK